MVFLLHKFAKLENHHHHHDPPQSEELQASLQAFRSEVSKFIDQLALDLKPGSEILSLSWIEKCLELLSITIKALANLAVDIDYPMSVWEVDSIEGYLSYSLCLLDLFNSISSSFSRLEQARLSLSHGLALLEKNSPSSATGHHLKAIQPGCFSTKFGEEFYTESDKARFFSGKEWVVHEAVKEIKSIGFWVCGVLLSGLCTDAKPYMELKKMAGEFDGSSILTLDSKISEGEVKQNPILKEVKEVNDALAELLVASDEVKHEATKELQTKLHVFEKLCDVVKAKVDDVFSKVMAQRTELIDCFQVRKQTDDTVGELKRRICELTNVLPIRQKLLYPKLGSKLNDDTLLLSQLSLNSALKFTMIGTTEEDLIVDPVEAPEIIDDLELPQEEAIDIKDMEVNKHKLTRRINQFKVELLNPCREGKKLLVLDIDYTLFDHRSTAENPLQLMRPYLHEFLASVYSEYDIMIWSATSMKWINLKMGQLGVLDNPNYKITALLDHLAMITVQTPSRGVFDCKPLGLIWAKFPEFYNASNTIMFDDLRRNFVMNPQNGLTIRPFRKAHANRDSDQELVKLTQYLLAIAELDDLSKLNHHNWESFTDENAKRRRHR